MHREVLQKKMATINLYQIDSNKVNGFKGELAASKLEKRVTVSRSYDKRQFEITLYVETESDSNELSWNWILEQFDQEPINTSKSPRAIVLLERKQKNKKSIFYAVTFGNSYFLVDKYCDRDFGFKFACRVDYTNVKTTTLTSPGLKRNKTVNTYINYNFLEFGSGESYSKLKANMKLDEGFNVFKQCVEIGSSIHFSIDNETITGILKVIVYVENILKIPDKEAKYKIPLFQQVKDITELQELENELDSVLDSAIIRRQRTASINIPELEIVGTKEIFGHIDNEYRLRYLSKTESIEDLSLDTVINFCRNNNVDSPDKIRKIKVVRYRDGQELASWQFISVIEYTDDKKKCILSQGRWYRFNKDYLTYLDESVDTVNAIYNPKYDFDSKVHDGFIDEMYNVEKDNYQDKSKQKVLKALKNKYYAERAFNLIREKEDGFKCYDREETSLGYEKMDLYEESTHTMFAVKIGEASSNLCYAVDQSLTSLKMYKHGQPEDRQKQDKKYDMPKIERVGLWLIFFRSKHLPVSEDNRVNLSQIDMLMLKNRIDQWIKEVRLSGYIPVVYINYRKKEKAGKSK